MSEEKVTDKEIQDIEKDIKDKEDKAKSKLEADMRKQIEMEQEMINLKKELAAQKEKQDLVAEEKKKLEESLLEQKKQHEEELAKAKEQQGSSKGVYAQPMANNVQNQRPQINSDDHEEIEGNSRDAFFDYLKKNNRFR